MGVRQMPERGWQRLTYQDCAILCPAKVPQLCMLNLYKELCSPGSTPVRASVWFSRWLSWQAEFKQRQEPLQGQLELPFE